MTPLMEKQADYCLDSQPATDLMEWWSKASGNFPLITESIFDSLCNLSRLIHHDIVINDSDDEPVMVETTRSKTKGD